jgi:hypothetical protein
VRMYVKVVTYEIMEIWPSISARFGWTSWRYFIRLFVEP